MQIDPSTLSPEALYQWTISVVIPRPIGWVSTVATNGVRNLAPFSFFNVVSGEPPIVMVSINQRKGQPKDTLVNILATHEFVVNLVDESLAQPMNVTSGNYPPEVDEFAMARLAPAPSIKINAPRVSEAPVSLECVLAEKVKLADCPYTIVFGRVVWFHIADRILNERGRVDPQQFQPVARLGGSGWYTTLGKLFAMQRPP